MADENVKNALSDLGFGGAEPSPVTGVVSDLAIKAAQKEVERKSAEYSWLDLVAERQADAGTIPSALALLNRPDPVAGEAVTPEVVDQLFEGITDERGAKRVRDALDNKGVTYARAIANEVRGTIEANKILSDAGLRGATAMIFSDVFDPADWAIAGGTALAVGAAAPVAAPVTVPVTAAGVKINRLFSKFKNNKKYLAMAAGVGGAELAGLEYLRAQHKYDITGGDIFLAGTIGAAGGAGFTKLAQVLTRRSQITQALRKQADGEVLTDFETQLLRQNDDEILARNFRNDSFVRDDFNIDEQEGVITGSGLTRKDFTEMTQEELDAVSKQRGVGAKYRGIISAFVTGKNSEDGVARWLSDGLGLNSTGNKDASAVGFGALEQRDTIVMRTRLRIANRIKSLREASGYDVADFNVLVSRQIRKPSDEAPDAVKQAAEVYKAEMDSLARQAIDANVAGFDVGTISRIDNYVPRIFNRGNIQRLREGRLRDNADGTINEGFNTLAEEAIRRGQPDIEARVKARLKSRKKKADDAAVQAFIKRMARGYIKSVINPSYGNTTRLKMANGDFDVQDFANIMKAEGFTSAEIDIMVDVMTRNIKVKGNKRSRPRMILDEMTEVNVTDSNGQLYRLRFNDLLEENVENLFDSYTFQLAGAIGLARNGINTNQLGSNFETIFTKMSTKATEAEKKAIRYMYESVTGEFAYSGRQIAGQEMGEGTAQFLRRMRELSFMANMGMSGMAALMELSNALFEYSLPTLMKTMPMYASLVKRAQNGELTNKVAREMTAATGIGSDGLVSKVTSMRSRLEGDVTEGITIDGEITKFDELLGKGRIATAVLSGLQGVTDVLRRISLYNYASEWALAHRKGQVAFSAIKREQLGITDDMANRIRIMIDDNADFLDNDTLDSLNLDRWADSEAADVFAASARREATQAVQEMNAGSVNPLLRSEVGKSFFQFLSFPMASLEQQAMRLGVRGANGDAGQVARIMLFSATLGSMMYMGRSYLNSMGRSDQEEYMKRRMRWHELIEGSLSQIGAASLFGYVYQLTTGTMDGNTNALTPAGFSMFASGIKGVTDTVDAVFGGDLTESELRSLLRVLPFTSLYGARQIVNALAQTAD